MSNTCTYIVSDYTGPCGRDAVKDDRCDLHTAMTSTNTMPCPRCKGRGAQPCKDRVFHKDCTAEMDECSVCQGTGVVPVPQETALDKMICSQCGDTMLRKDLASHWNEMHPVTAPVLEGPNLSVRIEDGALVAKKALPEKPQPARPSDEQKAEELLDNIANIYYQVGLNYAAKGLKRQKVGIGKAYVEQFTALLSDAFQRGRRAEAEGWLKYAVSSGDALMAGLMRARITGLGGKGEKHE